MEVLGIGPSELVMVILIALIVLGPRDMQKAGRTLGRWLNALVHSDSWKVVQKTSHELRNLPTNLMREANLEMIKTEADLRKAVRIEIPGESNGPNPPRNGTTSSSQIPITDAPSHPAGNPLPMEDYDRTILPPQSPAKKDQATKGE